MRLVLYEGRGELDTVTAGGGDRVVPAAARDHGASLRAAGAACESVLRLFGEGDGEPAAYNLLCHELQLLDADPAAAGPANLLAFRLKLLLAAGFVPGARGLRALRRGARGRRGGRLSFSPAAGGVVCAGCAPAATASRSTARRSSSWPRARRARSGGCRRPSRRRSRQVDRAVTGTLEYHAHVRLAASPERLNRIGVRSLDERRAAAGTKYVYDFSEGSREMRDLLGGKGANIAEMTRIGGPVRVPAGFTITTEACVAYMRGGGGSPTASSEQVAEALGAARGAGRQAPRRRARTRCSSRCARARASRCRACSTPSSTSASTTSRSRASIARTGNERFAWDSYRRFVQMFGNVVRGIDGERVRGGDRRAARSEQGVKLDTELDAGDLRALVGDFKRIFETQTGEEFPEDPREQLRQAIQAVFDSWNGERAIEYRRLNQIPDDWGTAVNVQQMVFGNKGDDSGSGVAFSRDENTGAPEPSGDFLQNAQGEDVVSGARNTRDLSELRGADAGGPRRADRDPRGRSSATTDDMQDVEFTIEEGTLYMLQTRNAKRPAQAAVRVAVDMVDGGPARPRRRRSRSIDADKLDALLHPTFDPALRVRAAREGGARPRPAPPRARSSSPPTRRSSAGGAGEAVILVRPFTEADDVAGFHAARGILTSEGGKASHAALVARGMGRPVRVRRVRARRSTSTRGTVVGERPRAARRAT